MEIIGKAMSVANIMKIIKKENWLFDQSEGGVSFSGGEPLMHPQILIPLLNECGKEKIHRCVDTSGFAPTDLLLEVAQKTELFMFDLKMMDSEKHKKYTGVSNEIITYNLKKLAETGAKINIRIPLIKNVNDDDENIIESAKFIASLTGEKKLVHLLPYHNLVESKYEKLNQNNSFIKFSEPEPDRLKQIVEIYTANSIETKIYG
jgi:pyruvate formate lyase activating enzyme